jgi:hypothetical protein
MVQTMTKAKTPVKIVTTTATMNQMKTKATKVAITRTGLTIAVIRAGVIIVIAMMIVIKRARRKKKGSSMLLMMRKKRRKKKLNKKYPNLLPQSRLNFNLY